MSIIGKAINWWVKKVDLLTEGESPAATAAIVIVAAWATAGLIIDIFVVLLFIAGYISASVF